MGPRMMFGGNAFSINGKTMDINRIDEVVKAGSTEIWHLENTSMMAHPLHPFAFARPVFFACLLRIAVGYCV
jgi:FtsP/CotA-like multicopper oxidase with cupredoxin domain